MLSNVLLIVLAITLIVIAFVILNRLGSYIGRKNNKNYVKSSYVEKRILKNAVYLLEHNIPEITMSQYLEWFGDDYRKGKLASFSQEQVDDGSVLLKENQKYVSINSKFYETVLWEVK